MTTAIFLQWYKKRYYIQLWPLRSSSNCLRVTKLTRYYLCGIVFLHCMAYFSYRFMVVCIIWDAYWHHGGMPIVGTLGIQLLNMASLLYLAWSGLVVYTLYMTMKYYCSTSTPPRKPFTNYMYPFFYVPTWSMGLFPLPVWDPHLRKDENLVEHT